MAEEPLAAEEAPGEPEAAPEVRPEEFTQGTAQPVGASAFPQDVIDELKKPLDPNRVRKREGKYEYLAGHDVYRRANEIFGFGQWGTTVEELLEIAAVEVVHKDNAEKKGWHVGYRCTIALWVQGMEGTISGVGFGNGVEYTPAARVNACELAVKEAETDAIKRAFTKLGDQFGLILYAKKDEKQRIERDLDSAAATRVALPDFPETWAAIYARMATVLGGDDEAKEWITTAALAFHGKPPGEFSKAEKDTMFGRLAKVTTDLEAVPHDLTLTMGARDQIARVFAASLDGLKPEGPPWRLDPSEEDRPVKDEAVDAGGAALTPEASAEVKAATAEDQQPTEEEPA